MRKIESIKMFSSAFDVIEEYFPGFFGEYEKDSELITYVKHFGDFESVSYFLINGSYVATADKMTGDVFGDLVPVGDFFKSIKAAYQAERR